MYMICRARVLNILYDNNNVWPRGGRLNRRLRPNTILYSSYLYYRDDGGRFFFFSLPILPSSPGERAGPEETEFLLFIGRIQRGRRVSVVVVVVVVAPPHRDRRTFFSFFLPSVYNTRATRSPHARYITEYDDDDNTALVLVAFGPFVSTGTTATVRILERRRRIFPVTTTRSRSRVINQSKPGRRWHNPRRRYRPRAALRRRLLCSCSYNNMLYYIYERSQRALQLVFVVLFFVILS